MKKRSLVGIFLIFYTLTNISYAQRSVVDLSSNWKFHLGHLYNVEKDFNYGDGSRLQFAKLEPAPYGSHSIDATILNFDDANWKNVNIPHDWAPDLPYDPKQIPEIGNRYGYKPVDRRYPETSIGWYRKIFDITKEDEGKIITLAFEGVFRDCKVWVNGFYMGSNWSGYTGFGFDISDYLRYGKKNIITVRVDATLHEGWFYEGAGINKEVYLVKTNPLHIENSGPNITTELKKNKAVVTIKTKLLNESFDDQNAKIISQIIDDKGNIITESNMQIVNLLKRTNHNFKQTLEINNPKYWSTDQPYRYTLLQTVVNNDKITDTYKTRFGVTSYTFNDKGFFLNNKRVQIKGTCIHQNFAGIGSGIPEAIHYYRLNLLKKMGVNAVRSHYPFSQSMLNACDSLGILVMDEVRSSGSTKESLNQVKWMIKNHRNHPSVFIWSMANEEGGTQRNIIGKKYMKKMVTLAHQLDSSRMVTAGVNAWGSNVDFGFSEEIDVMGFNYSLDFIDDYHKNHPDQPLIGTETSNASVTRGVYLREVSNDDDVLTDGVGGYYNSDGILVKLKKMPRHIAANDPKKYKHVFKTQKFYADRKFLAGHFIWTGFDYNGETWGGTFPSNSSQFGAIDLAGFPKDAFYYYQSWWTDKHVLHMAQHWNWEGNTNKNVDVLIFSNADEVVLYRNHKKLGRKKIPKYGYLLWKVKYKPGELKGIGIKNGKKVSEDVLLTSENPSQINLTPNKTVLNSKDNGIAVINVSITDKKGILAPLANNLVHFEIKGNAKIIGVGNGDPATAESDTKNFRKAFNGKAMVIIQIADSEDKIELIALSKGLKSSSVTIKNVIKESKE